MINAISYASCYVYSPTGICDASVRSRLLCSLLKSGNARYLQKYAARVRQEAAELPNFADFFGASCVLVPVPGSSPPSGDIPWISAHLAGEFARQGLGNVAWNALRRVRPVRKSATAPAGRRPTVDKHYDSFAIYAAAVPDVPAAQILLIDDVVTKGRTLLAAAMRVQEAFPDARIRAFALLRTMGLAAEVQRLLQPCVGEIRWRGGDAHRVP